MRDIIYLMADLDGVQQAPSDETTISELFELLLEAYTVDQILEMLWAENEPEDGRFHFRSAKLTQNGSGSLILTLPNEFWKDADIDHEDPGSVGIYYSSDERKAVMDLG